MLPYQHNINRFQNIRKGLTPHVPVERSHPHRAVNQIMRVCACTINFDRAFPSAIVFRQNPNLKIYKKETFKTILKTFGHFIVSALFF